MSEKERIKSTQTECRCLFLCDFNSDMAYYRVCGWGRFSDFNVCIHIHIHILWANGRMRVRTHSRSLVQYFVGMYARVREECVMLRKWTKWAHARALVCMRVHWNVDFSHLKWLPHLIFQHCFFFACRIYLTFNIEKFCILSLPSIL